MTELCVICRRQRLRQIIQADAVIILAIMQKPYYCRYDVRETAAKVFSCMFVANQN